MSLLSNYKVYIFIMLIAVLAITSVSLTTNALTKEYCERCETEGLRGLTMGIIGRIGNINCNGEYTKDIKKECAALLDKTKKCKSLINNKEELFDTYPQDEKREEFLKECGKLGVVGVLGKSSTIGIFGPDLKSLVLRLSVGIPGFELKEVTPQSVGKDVSLLLSALFKLLFTAAAIFITIVISYFGLRLLVLTSVGNVSARAETIGVIKNALMGLVILLGSFLILQTVNPNLLNINLIIPVMEVV